MNKIIGIVMLWLLLAILGGISEMAYMSVGTSSGIATDTTPHLQLLLTGWDYSEASNPIGYFTTTIGLLWDFFRVLGDMMFFNYPFFQGEWGIVRILIFIPIGIGVVWIIANWARGTSA